jgi:hypothetical protein
MQRLIQFFRQPFPYFQKQWHVVVVTASGVAVVLTIVLIVYDNPITFSGLLWFVGGYTVVSTICSALTVYLLPALFSRFFDAKRWTKGKYFVFVLILTLMIAVANTMYYYFLPKDIDCAAVEDISFSIVLYSFLINTFSIGIIPVTLGYFWVKNQGLYSNLQEKEDQNRKLIVRYRNEHISDEKLITLSGNTKDSLTLFPQEIIYLESTGNYVRVYYQKNGQIAQKTLRATLLQMEERLSDYPFLVRCHRAFVVNTCRIERINKGKLWLKSVATAIPVSQTYKANIQDNEQKPAILSQK